MGKLIISSTFGREYPVNEDPKAEWSDYFSEKTKRVIIRMTDYRTNTVGRSNALQLRFIRILNRG